MKTVCAGSWVTTSTLWLYSLLCAWFKSPMANAVADAGSARRSSDGCSHAFYRLALKAVSSNRTPKRSLDQRQSVSVDPTLFGESTRPFCGGTSPASCQRGVSVQSRHFLRLARASFAALRCRSTRVVVASGQGQVVSTKLLSRREQAGAVLAKVHSRADDLPAIVDVSGVRDSPA